ncbi:hypothetical protein MMC10_004925 [Thelotrema lepadinum]|nr:hypothetical protein [Thelotrema lepadinum]
MPPRSPTFMNARNMFTDPFRATGRPQGQFTRSSRSPSASSTTSTSSFYSTSSSLPGAASLNEILALGYSTKARNASLTSVNSSRRPSCFSILEAEEERAEFGEEKIGMLEPRNNVGWWGMAQVLEEEQRSS